MVIISSYRSFLILLKYIHMYIFYCLSRIKYFFIIYLNMFKIIQKDLTLNKILKYKFKINDETKYKNLLT